MGVIEGEVIDECPASNSNSADPASFDVAFSSAILLFGASDCF